MLNKKMLALFLATCVMLCGCQAPEEVESQAYVLVLALERGAGGALELTARIPRIGQSGKGSDQEEADASPYLTFSVSGASWPSALEALQWATPRKINLSHIGMIVVSESLASEPGFTDLMNQLSDAPHLYTTAYFVVCRGSAKRFLEAGKTIIGTRMSAEIGTMIRQYALQGFVPPATLADAHYAAGSIYGDPVAIWAFLPEEQPQEATMAASDPPWVQESPMTQRFGGTALFKGGSLVGTLSVEETSLLNLIRGQTGVLSFRHGPSDYELTPEGHPAKGVTFSNGNARLSLSVALSTTTAMEEEERSALESAVGSAISALVELCRQLGCDPFGFSEAAARHFTTVAQWLAGDWRELYSRASLDVDVHIRLR